MSPTRSTHTRTPKVPPFHLLVKEQQDRIMYCCGRSCKPSTCSTRVQFSSMPGYQLSREGRYLHWSEELCQYARPSFICRLWSLSTICAYPSFPVSLLFDLPCSASLTGNVLFCHQDCPSPCCEKTLPSKTSWRRAILFGLNRDGRLRPYPQLHLHRHRCSCTNFQPSRTIRNPNLVSTLCRDSSLPPSSPPSSPCPSHHGPAEWRFYSASPAELSGKIGNGGVSVEIICWTEVRLEHSCMFRLQLMKS